MRTILKAALATAAFAAVHSALASLPVKRAAGKRIGDDRVDAGYRVFFVAQSLLPFTGLVTYAAQLPSRTVYRVAGTAALPLRVGQLAGVLHLISGLRAIGFTRWAGLRHLQAWREGAPVPPGPAAQGPEMTDDGSLSAGGPFRCSRHPLNFSAIPIFWLTPHMTTRRLGFNLASTLYFILGSVHEEARLRAAYGEAYVAYRERGIPFFLPFRLGGSRRARAAEVSQATRLGTEPVKVPSGRFRRVAAG